MSHEDDTDYEDMGEELAEAQELIAELEAKLAAVCEEHGHPGWESGDWPEDRVCTRCGTVEVEAGFTVDIVPALEPNG